MMKVSSFLLILLAVVPCFATTRYVAKDGSAPYTEVQNAINASAARDTILVAPSATAYNGFNVDRRLVLVGAGYDQTPGKATVVEGIVEIYDTADSTELTGFRVRVFARSNVDSLSAVLRLRSGATGVRISRCVIENTACCADYAVGLFLNKGASAVIDACTIWDSYSSWGGQYGIWLTANSPAASATITNCLFSYWGSCAINVPNNNTVCHIRHCIFDCPAGIGSNSTFLTAQNCVLASTGTFLSGSGPLVTYCATGGSAPAGEGNFHYTGTPFVNQVAYAPLNSDYHLSSGSMLRDAGNPISPPDLDGSRADIGIYGGQTPFTERGIPPIPYVLELEVPPIVPQNGVLHIGARGRIGPGN